MDDKPEGKRYREPESGSKEAELVDRFAEAGIEVRIEDAEPGEHRLIFFGALPEEPEEDGEDED